MSTESKKKTKYACNNIVIIILNIILLISTVY